MLQIFAIYFFMFQFKLFFSSFTFFQIKITICNELFNKKSLHNTDGNHGAVVLILAHFCVLCKIVILRLI